MITSAARATLCLYLLAGVQLVGCSDEPAPAPEPATSETAAGPKAVAEAVPESVPVPVAQPETGLADKRTLPDFSSISHVPTLKRMFYEYLHPMVLAENARIDAQRLRLESLRQRHERGDSLVAAQHTWLAQLADEYRLTVASASPTAEILTGILRQLMHRVDIVPPDLALAQAAIESGWGRSRFARLGNNIYGEWCFVPGCGIVPRDRKPGARHEIADFDSPAGSIRSYMHNLNTHDAYEEWRAMRGHQRLDGASLGGHELAAGLTAYSELREEYVQRVRDVIRQNAHLMGPAPVNSP
jgi:Bax protein